MANSNSANGAVSINGRKNMDATKKENHSLPKYKVYLRFFWALIAGCILPLSFAPFDLWPFAIASPAFLLWLWQRSNKSHAFYQGLCFGLGFFGIGASWVFVSIHYFGNTDVPLAIFITFLFVVILSLFLAVQGFVFKSLFKGDRFAENLLGFPALWVIFEWIRSFLFSGFPWLYLGYAGLNTPLRGFAPWLSVYGVSFSLLLSSGFLISILQEKKSTKRNLLFALLCLWTLGAILSHINYTKPLGKTYSVSLVQGNVPPLDKFASANPIQAVEKTYGKLTEPYWDSDLVLWPENAIPLPIPLADPFIAKLNRRASANKSTLIAGIQTIVNSNDYYNSMVAMGGGSGLYHKRHLVPFGEFLPFDNYLRGLINFFNIPMSNFVEGPDAQASLKMDDITIAPLICYEIAFPQLVRSIVLGTNVIVNLSEDGWFGKSFGPHQHLQIAQMRALETGRYILRATTSGITAIIKPDGSLDSVAPQFEATVLTGRFEAREGNTPWMSIGLWPLLVILLMLFFVPGRWKSLSEEETFDK